MGNPYPVLTYRGDLAEQFNRHAGRVFGFDESFRPYEIIDAEHEDGRTILRLQYASPETVKADSQEYQAQVNAEGLRRAGL